MIAYIVIVIAAVLGVICVVAKPIQDEFNRNHEWIA